MLSWSEFAKAEPEMASFGEERIKFNLMYLGTIRKDSFPRVHPFTPYLGNGHLFASMYPSSPKGKDLQRDGKYCIHSLVSEMTGKNGEFQITGEAKVVRDRSLRDLAMKSCPYLSFAAPDETAILFEFMIGECFTNYYGDGKSHPKRWKLNSKTNVG